jgi:hypothetical protein
MSPFFLRTKEEMLPFTQLPLVTTIQTLDFRLRTPDSSMTGFGASERDMLLQHPFSLSFYYFFSSHSSAIPALQSEVWRLQSHCLNHSIGLIG